MKRSATRWLLVAAKALTMVVAGAYVAAHVVVPPRIDRQQNAVFNPGPYEASPEVRALHERLLVADMHADSLIWGRDLLRRTDRGQVDLPRLRDANVALQVFSVPTKVGIDRGAPDSLNLLTISAATLWWPPHTWWNLTSRARHAAMVLHDAAAHSAGALSVVRSAPELTQALARRRAPSGDVAALLAIEGLHALEGDEANVQRLFDAGFRMMGLLHQFDNDLGGSSTGASKGGLTPFGARVVSAMESRGMLVDLAHASPAVIGDVGRMATRPLVVSHTGVQGTCPRPRNLSDDEIRIVARTGGVVGVGFWSGAVCGPDAAAVARAIRHVSTLVGVDHVALGSDFDGDRMPFDVRGIVAITGALLREGFSEDEIRLVMGGNLIALLTASLPRR